MYIILHLLFIIQSLQIVRLNRHENKHFIRTIKRNVYSSSIQNLNRFVKTYENNENIILNTPNFTLIKSLVSTKSSIREHSQWLMRSIFFNQFKEIVRYDLNNKIFALHFQYNNSFILHPITGDLILLNNGYVDFLHTEINLHSETGLSQGDEIIHDIYRFIRLSTNSINCTENLTINISESIDIECSINYEFYNYEDLENYQPMINFTFYYKQNSTNYKIDFNEINDIQINENKSYLWQRLIRYRIPSIHKHEIHREYFCMLTSDSIENNRDNIRTCQTNIYIRNNQSTIMTFSHFEQFDMLIVILIVFSTFLFLISLILCLVARQYHKKRLIQIKPEQKTLTNPLNTNQIFSNNNEIKSEFPSKFSENYSSDHKPGCPRYLPSSEYNLLTSNLFTHTTIDNIKKIILPDIPDNSELFNDQTYIHFYIPSKSENVSIKKFH